MMHMLRPIVGSGDGELDNTGSAGTPAPENSSEVAQGNWATDILDWINGTFAPNTNITPEEVVSGHYTQEHLDNMQQNVAQSGLSATSAKGSEAEKYNLSSITGSSAYENSRTLQAMYDMYIKTGDVAWLEKLIDSYGSIENNESARAFEKMMSDTSFSRLIEDIKKSGYNPWLALQNGYGQASSYSTSAAGISNVSPSQQATSRATNANSVDQKNLNTILSTAGSLIGSLIWGAIMLMLA